MTGQVGDRAWQVPALFAEIRPQVTARLAEAGEAARAVVDQELLELSRLRLAALLGHEEAAARRSAVGPPESKIGRLSRWPDDPAFTQRERDCLAFLEQYVMDVASVDDALVASAARHFTPGGFKDYVVALYLTEITLRLELAQDGLLRPTAGE